MSEATLSHLLIPKPHHDFPLLNYQSDFLPVLDLLPAVHLSFCQYLYSLLHFLYFPVFSLFLLPLPAFLRQFTHFFNFCFQFILFSRIICQFTSNCLLCSNSLITNNKTCFSCEKPIPSCIPFLFAASSRFVFSREI